MAVKDHDRALVYNWFDANAGTEVAAAIMEMLPPVDWTDVATRQDIATLGLRIDQLEARMATKNDLERITSRMATKDDLTRITNRMATKDDLERMATKDDLERLVTKDDLVHRLERMVTEERLEKRLESMATKQDVAELQVALQRTFVTWMLASQTATIAAIGVVLAMFV